jgi:hypothetical protein
MLARVLRSEKPAAAVLQALADLIAPDSKNPRKFIIKSRRGNQSNPIKDRVIAYFIKPSRRGRKKPVKLAMRHFGLSRDAVQRALARDKKLHPELHM